MNKITWFTKQLQHKANAETLQLSPAGDEYMLSMANLFALDYYGGDTPTVCGVSQGAGALDPMGNLYFANIARGNHYRLTVNGQEVLFKIMPRKIWFFAGVEAVLADLAVDVWTKENSKNPVPAAENKRKPGEPKLHIRVKRWK